MFKTNIASKKEKYQGLQGVFFDRVYQERGGEREKGEFVKSEPPVSKVALAGPIYSSPKSGQEKLTQRLSGGSDGAGQA